MKSPFDLHVLGMPPAFVLSQDQTLRLKTVTANRPRPIRSNRSTGTVTQDDPRNLSFEPCDSLRSLQDVLTDDPDLGPNRTSTVPPPAHPFSQSIHLSKIPRAKPAPAEAENSVEPGGSERTPNDCGAVIIRLVPGGP